MIWVHGFHLAILPAFLDRTVKVRSVQYRDQISSIACYRFPPDGFSFILRRFHVPLRTVSRSALGVVGVMFPCRRFHVYLTAVSCVHVTVPSWSPLLFHIPGAHAYQGSAHDKPFPPNGVRLMTVSCLFHDGFMFPCYWLHIHCFDLFMFLDDDCIFPC